MEHATKSPNDSMHTNRRQHWGHHALSGIYAIIEYYRRTKNGEQDGAANAAGETRVTGFAFNP